MSTQVKKKFSLKDKSNQTIGNRIPKKLQLEEDEGNGDLYKGIALFGIKKLSESPKYLALAFSIVFFILYGLFSSIYDFTILVLNHKTISFYTFIILVSLLTGHLIYKNFGWFFEHKYLSTKLYFKGVKNFSKDDIHILMESRYIYSKNKRDFKLRFNNLLIKTNQKIQPKKITSNEQR